MPTPVGTDWKKLFAERLVSAREGAFLSRYQLSLETDLYNQHIAALEQCECRHKPKPINVYALAMATDKKPQEWFDILGQHDPGASFIARMERFPAIEVSLRGRLNYRSRIYLFLS